MKPVPAIVYDAARRIYLDVSNDLATDNLTVHEWATSMWSRIPNSAAQLAFWVLSQAAQDGHEA